MAQLLKVIIKPLATTEVKKIAIAKRQTKVALELLPSLIVLLLSRFFEAELIEAPSGHK